MKTLTLSALTSLTLAPALASAEDPQHPEPSVHVTRHDLHDIEQPFDHGHHHLGFRLVMGQSVGAHPAAAAGWGLMGEHHLWGPLEFEWVGQIEDHGAETTATESVAIKAPWHLTEHVDLFVAAGAMARQHDHGALLSGGFVGSGGATFWWGQDVGVLVEVEWLEDLARHTHEVEGVVAFLIRLDPAGTHAHASVR
jgi:hypothetical protein